MRPLELCKQSQFTGHQQKMNQLMETSRKRSPAKPEACLVGGVVAPANARARMINQKPTPLTSGVLIAAVHAACGKAKAKEMVRPAVNAPLVEFRGHDRFVILELDPDKILSFP
ncbi:MAG TPA: hypothetical protein VG077_10345 [Verrucomicrobiae bacterium]|nr:hypothetical protein [Verrucomicrobiae bacterium]